MTFIAEVEARLAPIRIRIAQTPTTLVEEYDLHRQAMLLHAVDTVLALHPLGEDWSCRSCWLELERRDGCRTARAVAAVLIGTPPPTGLAATARLPVVPLDARPEAASAPTMFDPAAPLPRRVKDLPDVRPNPELLERVLRGLWRRSASKTGSASANVRVADAEPNHRRT